MTSRELVNRVQRRLRREMNDRSLKVGHTGTLDPLADGLVVIAVGAAARLTPWMLQHAKRYSATFRFGESSVSGDLEEPVTPLADAPIPSHAEVQTACESLLGWIDQTPPSHSAIWVDGQRAHERIRRGETVDMPTRQVWIDSIDVSSYDYPNLNVDVRCGSGTYLRTLGMDIATRCQTVAVMTRLTRTEVGPFDLETAVEPIPPHDPPPTDPAHRDVGLTPMPAANPLAGTTFTPGNVGLWDRIESPLMALAHLPFFSLSDEDTVRVRSGIWIDGDPESPSEAALASTAHRALAPDKPYGEHGQTEPPPAECLAIDPEGELAGILRRKQGHWAPYRVFAKSK